MFNKDGLYFLPLGGADEIGLNCYVYASNGKLIVVDAGYGFLNDDYPGMDMALPDASFLKDYKKDIEGLFISHAHEDHFGAIAHIWPLLECPVYATEFTLKAVAARLKEHKIENVPLIMVDDQPVKLKNFEVEFLSLVHSVPETSGLFIKTAHGKVVHATDWRFDDGKSALLPTDFPALKRVAEEGVNLFVCDSTNVLVDKEQFTEKDVRESLLKLIPQFDKGLIATCFASNLVRLESLILAAYEGGRVPVLVGRSIIQSMKNAKECGYFQDLPDYISIENAKDIPAEQALYICTGSQGNYRSALSRIVKDEMRDIKLADGDAIIFSSKIIPGNEDKIEAMQEILLGKGVEVITESEYLVHTSGHANKRDLKQMYEILKPEIIVPVHGDKKFIKAHKNFAIECGIKEVATVRNGDIMFIAGKKIEKLEQIHTDVFGVDRNNLVRLTSELVKNRIRLMYNCSVFISVVFNKEWQLKDLQISSIDILEKDAWEELSSKIKKDIIEKLPSEVVRLKYKEAQIADYIRIKARKTIEKTTEIKPVTFLHFTKLED